VYFDGFWPGFLHFNNQILDLIRLALPDIDINVTTIPAQADISIYSCYGTMDTLTLTKNSFRLLFLGENVRPSFTEFDISLTSDVYDYCDRNIYLPLWMLEFAWPGMSTSYPDRTLVDPAILVSDDLIDYRERLPRVVYIGNNHEPFRTSIIMRLRESGIIVDNYGSHSRPVHDKHKILQRYKITLAPENSLFEGYVTEKPIHSFVAGTHGIYRGGHRYSGLNIASNPLFTIVDSPDSFFRGETIEELNDILVSNSAKRKPLIKLDDANHIFRNLLVKIENSLRWLTELNALSI
jgi:hypothetical protein